MSFGQNKIDLKADFNVRDHTIKIKQRIVYQNTSEKTLDTIYLNNWPNSYATKKTALATRIADEFINDFHLAKNEDRGYSVVTSMTQDSVPVDFKPLKDQIDVLKVVLNKPVKPGESYTLNLAYVVKVPNSKFTSYGVTDIGDYNLRYWYITPAVFDGSWHYYSNKGLDDLYIPKADIDLEVNYPEYYDLTSELDKVKNRVRDSVKTQILTGKDRISTKLFLNKEPKFNRIKGDDFSLISSISDTELDVLDKVLITERISKFLFQNFGQYPFNKLLVTQIDYDKNPIYGLNFLPKFIKPYPDHFQYELKVLKIALHNYLENTLLLNPRKEQWLLDGIQMFYMMNYVDEFYPDMKFLGSIADFWGVRSFHAADMRFNDKYVLGFMLMARTNRDQPLNMAKDSLLKFNNNIANKYKAGVGFKYLDDFINSDTLEAAIEDFLYYHKLEPTSTKEFESFLKSRTKKNIDWFFDDYVNSRKKIDFKIKSVRKTEDSITLTIKNKRENKVPVSLFTLRNDTIVSKRWIEAIDSSKTITIPRENADKLVLNYNKVIPEINLRDNWKSLKGFFFNNKPLQVRVFQDVEDPYYNQLFFMPVIEFRNIYDGLTLGLRAYNKTLLHKRLNYKLEPKYSLQSKSITGSGFVSMTHYLENSDLYDVTYGLGFGYSSYAKDLFVRQFAPTVKLYFREADDFRSNKRQLVSLRYVDIHRDKDVNNILTKNEPNYGVFNARYIYSNDNLIHFNKWYTDFQLGHKFSKLSFTYEYRRLFENNRQLNMRLFTGFFLKNDNPLDSDYFSFALDRPTDYLFDYNYLGRSEASGIFSQQYIDAEGGFKSKLETPFANQWISTLNVSTTLWKYVLMYGDLGVVKNKFNDPFIAYDSGIRVNLVTDYFEIYFPVYSNLGWEISQPNYSQKIRFKFTVDPQVLFGLFRRRWY
ncbi:hypothetical protein GCM10022260_23070 [Gaetbulibacter aestuarii]